MAYLVTLGGSDYDEAMDLTLGIKKMACKLAKCLKEAEEMDEDYPEDEYLEEDMEFRGRPRYRNDGNMDSVPSQGNSMGSSTSMRRGRGSNGRYTRMRKRRMMMDPMDWY